MASESSVPAGSRKSDRTREAILDAARIAFARKGFSAVTIRDITELAGVARANFYYYFRDKTELFIELGTATYREAVAVVETFGDFGDPPSSSLIEEWVNRYFAYLDRNGAFVIRSEDDMPPDRRFRMSVARSHRRTASALGERIAKMAVTAPAIDPAAMGLAVMAMLDRCWSTVGHNETPTIPRGAVLAAATEIVWRIVS